MERSSGNRKGCGTTKLLLALSPIDAACACPGVVCCLCGGALCAAPWRLGSSFFGRALLLTLLLLLLAEAPPPMPPPPPVCC